MKRILLGVSLALLVGASDARAEFRQIELSIYGMD